MLDDEHTEAVESDFQAEACERGNGSGRAVAWQVIVAWTEPPVHSNARLLAGWPA